MKTKKQPKYTMKTQNFTTQKLRNLFQICVTLVLFTLITLQGLKAQVSQKIYSSSNPTVYSGLVISAGTQVNVSATDDDNVYALQNIGFDFAYCGNTYTTVGICANGFLKLGSAPSNTYSGAPTGQTNIISAFNNDLQGPNLSNSKIRIQTIGASPNRVCVVQWSDWSIYPYNASVLFNFQIRLSEADGKVQIVYGPCTPYAFSVTVGLSGNSTTDFNVLSSTTTWASPTVITSGTATMTLSTIVYPDSGRTYQWTNRPMAIDSVTTTQITNPVPTGTINAPIIGVVVYTNGTLIPRTATQINFNTNGTTDTLDISNAKVFYTGNSSTFAATNQFGNTVVNPGAGFNVSGSRNLTGGANYFWLTYNIANGGAGHSVDASCTLLVDSFIYNKTPLVTSPAGSRTILAPLSGNYTVGTTGTYTTITAAINDLNSLGASGPVSFSLLDASYTTETFPITISAYPGMSSTNSLTIRPDASASAGVLILGSSTTQLFVISGAKYVTLDGRIGGTGTTRGLTFNNTANGTDITIQNDAIGTNLKYCVFRSGNINTVSGSVYIAASTGFYGNDSITISNCYFSKTSISGYYNGIYSQGQSTNIQNDVININNNEFNGFQWNGIYSSGTGNGSYWTVSGNSFYDTALVNAYYSTWTAINLSPGSAPANYYSLNNNYIGGQAAMCGGGPLTNQTAQVRQGIYLNTSSGPANTIYGNVIQNFYLNSISIASQFTGINVVAGAANIDSNTIGSATTANSILQLTNSVFLGINATPSVVNINVTRNTIANIYTNYAAGTAGGVRAMNVGGSAITTISNNIIKSLKTNSGNAGTTTAQSIAGITCSGSGINNITNNIIGGGLAAPLSNSNALTAGVRVCGIYVSGGLTTISDNIIDGLIFDSTATTAAGTTISANMQGICNASSVTGQIISNNIVRHLFQPYSSASQTTQINGILYAGSAAHTISGNTVNGIYSRTTYTGTSTGAAVNAIMNASSGKSTITNNYIDSIVINSPTAAIGSTMNGIIVSGTVGNSINGNIVKSMYSNSSGTYSINGIYTISGNIHQNVTNNQVYNLVNTNATAVATSIVGIRVVHSTALTNNTNLVTGNFVHSFRLYSTASAAMYGIENQQGSTWFMNNMVRLGLDSTGAAFTGPYVIYGLNELYAGGTVPVWYYNNSVYIGGAPTSSNVNTAALNTQSVSRTMHIKNNILVNAVVGPSALSKNYALLVYNTTGINSNYNILYAPNANAFIAGIISSSTTYTTLTGLTGWRYSNKIDGQSGMGNPNFVDATGTSSAVNLHLAASNPAENAGDPTTITSVAVDYDNATRSTSMQDIGADEGDFTMSSDILPPTITFTNLTNTSSTANRDITVSIIDNGGIPTTSTDTLRPWIYFKKGSGSWYSKGGVLTSGTSRNGTWTLTIDNALMGGVANADIISYFVVAQDSAANYASNPMYSLQTDVNTISAYPAIPNSYTIAAPIPTILVVGPTGTYPTLTGIGGAFAAINAGVLQGNTTILLQSGIIAETASFQLNQWLEVNNGLMGFYNYTLTIRPQTATLTTLSGATITLNGADRVTFLGYDTLGTLNDTNLIIKNTSGTAFVIQNDACNLNFRNIIFEGNTSNVVLVQNSVLTGNDNHTFNKCKFRASALPSYPSYLLFRTGTTGKENDTLLINDCEFYNFSVYAYIENGGGGNYLRILNNHFYEPLTMTSGPNYFVYFAPGTLSNNNSISGNYIGGTTRLAGGTPLITSFTSQMMGVYIASNGTAAGTTVSNNIMKNINMTTSGYMNGFYLASGVINASGNMFGDTAVANSITFGATSTGQMYGHFYSGTAITANNNIVSNITMAGNQIFYAMYNNTGVTQMNNNLVQNINNTNVAGASIQIRGIYSLSATITQMNNNIVRNFRCNSAGASTTTSAAVVGIMNASATALTMNNNIVQNLVNTNNTATHSMYGIFHSSGLATMNGNLIENLSSGSLYTGTTTVAAMVGLYNSSGTTGQTITNNTVRNLNLSGTTTTLKQVIGLMVSAGGNHIITGNLVQSIRTNSNSTSTLTGASIIGMYLNHTASSMVVSNNTINTLENTYAAGAAAVNVIGMWYSNSITTGTNMISRNLIHGLKLSTPLGLGVVTGMHINTSTNGNFSNNMIRLGYDSLGNAFTDPYTLNGILVATGSVNGYYHNTVYVAGSPSSGAANTHAFQMSTSSASLVDIRNNIFWNAASNGGTATGFNYALKLSAASNTISNNNILYANGTNGNVGATASVNYATLRGASSWQLGTGLDLKSGSGNPQFANPNASGADMNLRLQSTNPAEGMGDPTVVTYVTTDFDNNMRSNLTPTDIGANAGNNTLGADIFAPVISYSAIGNSSNTVGPLTLSGVNITDAAGIYTSGTLSPRLYYKKGVNGTYTSVAPTSNTGNALNATFVFNIAYAGVGGVALGDSIYYYVLAQDLAGNNVSNATYAVATDVNTVVSNPLNPGMYRIIPAISSAAKFYVGTGKTFTSLTNTGGLFEYLNSGSIAQNITAVITSDISTETGAVSLNQLAETGTGAGSYTLTIRPDSSATSIRTISGNVAVALINVNGADRIKISGIPDQSSSTTAQLLRIRNSGIAAPTIQFSNGAQACKISNTILEGANALTNLNTAAGVVLFGVPSTTDGNSFDSIVNCNFTNDGSQIQPLGIPTVCIQSISTSVAVLNSYNYINGNHIQNFAGNGINVEAGSGNGWIITNNHFFNNLTSPVTFLSGLTVTASIRFQAGIWSDGNTITGNVIGGQGPNASGSAWVNNYVFNFQCISYNGGNNLGATVSNNTIKNISLTSYSTGCQFVGINHGGGKLIIDGNTIGDPTNINSISLSGATTHLIITSAATTTVPVIITNNTIQGIFGNSPGNAIGLSCLQMTGGVPVVSNNTFGHATTANSIRLNGSGVLKGIIMSVAIGVGPTSTISNNTIANMTASGTQPAITINGITVQNTSVTSITGNRIYNLNTNSTNTASGAGATTAASGIVYSVSGTPIGAVIDQNLIYNIAANNTGAVLTNAVGINAANLVGLDITRNRIWDIKNLSTSNGFNPMATATGILLGSFTNLVNVSNNQITLGTGLSNNVQFNGIWLTTSNTTMYANVYYNSVLINGTVSAGNLPSYAFHRGNNTTAEITTNIRLTNNILINNRSGGASKNYAIANEILGTPTGPGWVTTAVNYNLLSSTSASSLGLWGTLDQNVSTWKTISGGDANSYTLMPGTGSGQLNISNLFTDIANGNLDIQAANSEAYYVNGKGTHLVGLTNDYGAFSSVRPSTVSGGATDIGADEVNATGTAPNATSVVGSHTAGGTEDFYFAGRKFASITWGNSGTLPTLSNTKYWTGKWPNDPSNNNKLSGVRFLNSYVDITTTGGSAYSYDMTLFYDDALTGTINSRNNLFMSKKQSAVLGTWQTFANSTRDNAINSLSKTGLSSFGEFSGFDTSNLISAPVISGIDLVCPLSSVNYSITALTGHTYVWSAVNGTITAGQGTGTVTITWAGSGTGGTVNLQDNIVATNDVLISLPFTVTFNTYPNIPSISGLSAICAGNSTTYTTPSTSGRIYTWSSVGGSISSTTANSATILWSTSGSRSVTVKDSMTSTGCYNMSSPYSVQVNVIPNPSINGSNSVCANAPSSYSISSNSGRTYVWSVSGGTIGSGQGTANITVNWGAVGTGNVSVSDSVNATGCKGSTGPLSITINSSPNPIISGVTTVCQNSTSTYSSAYYNGHAYIWNITNGTLISGQGTNIISVLWSNSGTGSVVLTDSILSGGCKGTTAPYNVTINPLPNPAISGSAVACANNAYVYTTASASNRYYTWVAAGGTITSGQGTNSATITWGANSVGLLVVTDSNTSTGCKTTSPAYFVNINPLPTPIIVGNNTVCASTSATYSATANAGRTYVWSVTGGTIASGQGTATLNVNWGTGASGSVSLTETINTTGCNASTAAYAVTINPVIASNTIGTAQVICTNSGAAPLTGSNPTGGNNSYTYLWESSTSSSSAGFSNASGTNNTQAYTPGTLTQTTWFRRVVNAGVCASNSSASVQITNNSILGNSVSSSQSVCYNKIPASFTGTLPTGGTGIFSYLWQFRTTGSYSTVSGTSNGINYSPSALTITTQYRRVINSGICVDTSSEITITIVPSITGNSVTPTTPICAGGSPNLFGSNPSGGAGAGTYTFLWQKGTSATANYVTGLGVNNNQNYSAPAITGTSFFRRVAMSGVCTDTSIGVVQGSFPALGANNYTGTQTICSGNTALLSGSNGSGGNGQYVYLWQSSTTDSTRGYSNAAGINNTASHTSAPLTVLTYFRRIITSGNAKCIDSGSFTPATISITPAINGNSIGSAQTICTGSSAATLTGTTTTGGNNTYTFVWVSSTSDASSGYAAASGTNNGSTYSPGVLSATTWLKRVTYSGTCIDSSAAVQITVNEVITNNTIGTAQTICTGTSAAMLTGASATGGNGNAVYVWESSTTSATAGFAAASGINNSQNYNTGSLSATTWYRRTVSAGVCASNTSAAIQITVNPAISNNSVSTSQTICSGTAPAALTGTAASGGAAFKINEDFNGGSVPSTWSIVNASSLLYGISTINSYGRAGTAGALYADNYNVSSSSATVTSAAFSTSSSGDSMRFDVAAASYPGYVDSLTVWAGNGTNFTRIAAWQTSSTVDINSGGITTVAAMTGGFVPSSTQWGTKAIALPTGTTQIRFNFISGYGNNIYIDKATVDNIPFVYTWQSSTTSATAGYAAASGTNNGRNYAPSTLTASTWYRRVAASGVCPADTSASISITVNPVIGNNTIGTAQTICSGSNPATLTGSAATGGNGTYSFTWLSSTTSATAGFTAASGANTATNYNSGALSATTWFKRVVSAGVCSNDTSATVQITVNPAIASNSISASQTICSGTAPAALTGTAASGGSGTYTYLWESSTTSATAGYASASGTNNTQNYTAGTLTATSWYRRSVTSGICGTNTSTSIEVTVNPVIANNTIGTAQTICAGTSAAMLTGASATGGSGSPVYVWESSTTSATAGFAAASGVNNAQNYNTGTLSVTTWYRRTVSAGVCTSNTSTTVQITVNPVIASNTVSSPQIICSGTAANALTGSNPSGGNSSYTYQWQSSTVSASSGFNNASGSSSSAGYSTGNLTNTTWYRRLVSAGVCTSDISNVIEVTVNPGIANNSIGSNQTICITSTPSVLVGSAPSGGASVYSYLWLMSTTSASSGFTAANSPNNGQHYFSGNLTQTTWFKRTVSSGVCTDNTSNVISITVDLLIANNTVTADQTICTGTAPTTLAGSTTTGGSGVFTNLWQVSTTSSTTGYTSASGSNTGSDYSPSALTETSWYRRVVSSGVCANSNSASVKVTVSPLIANNTATADQSICTGMTPAKLTGSAATGGSGTYNYVWESSTTDASSGYSTASGTTVNSDYEPSALTASTWFRRIVSSGGCTDTIATVKITVNPVIADNNAGANLTKCFNTSAMINGSAPSGGDGTAYAYLWQNADTSGVYSNAPDSNSLEDYTTINLNQNTWYKRLVRSGGCADTSAAILVSMSARNTWTGDTSDNWAIMYNWACGRIPILTDSVEINSGTPFQPHIYGAGALANTLQLNALASLTMDQDSSNLTLMGDLLRDTTSVMTNTKGTIHFLSLGGSTSQQMAFGNYYNVVIDNYNGVNLDANNVSQLTSINGYLSFHAGKLFLKDNNLKIGANGTIISVDNQKYVVTNGSGSLIKASLGMGGNTSAFVFPIGSNKTSYTPATVSNKGKLNDISAKVIDAVYMHYTGHTPIGTALTDRVVNKTWFIDPSNSDTSLNVDLTLQWNAGNELSNFARLSSHISQYVDFWHDDKSDFFALGNDPYNLSITGLKSLSPFAVRTGKTSGLEDVNSYGNHELITSVRPNPFTVGFAITFNVAEKSDVRIVMTDISGKIINQSNIKADKGLNDYLFADLMDLNDGVYFVSIVTSNKVLTHKVMKHH